MSLRSSMNPIVRRCPLVVLFLWILFQLRMNGVLLQRIRMFEGVLDHASSTDEYWRKPLRNMRQGETITERNVTHEKKMTHAHSTSNPTPNSSAPEYTTTEGLPTGLDSKNQRARARRKFLARSQDGVNSTHMEMDGLWIQNLTTMLGCPEANDIEGIKAEDLDAYTNIPTKETWNALYRAYHATVDPNHQILTSSEYHSGWKVPIEVKYHRPEGRGVYAKEFIPNGTLVWVSTSRNTATFYTSHHHRLFLEYLFNDPSTRKLACDVRMWIDVIQWNYSGDEYAICQTFDEGVLLNTAFGDSKDLEHLFNIDTAEMPIGVEDPDYDENDCYGNDHYFAFRDIQAGEQLRIDYGMGEGDDNLGWFAMGLL